MLAAMAHYVAFASNLLNFGYGHFSSIPALVISILIIFNLYWLIEIPTRESEDWFGLIQKSSETKLVAYYTIFL